MRKEIVALLILLLGTPRTIAADVEQTTNGWCSPAQSGNGNVVVCNGVDPRAMKRLNDDLDRMGLTLKRKTDEADEWARQYKVLNEQYEAMKKQLAAKGKDLTAVQTGQNLLHEGQLEEARKKHDQLMAIIRKIQALLDPGSLLRNS